jgi:Tol biopolymer transport system component
MGEVYRARDPRLGREVAVKLIAFDAAGRPDRVRRFEQEARAVAALNHPNVLSVYDVGTEAGAPYLVFELLEGESLRTRLVREPVPPRRAIEWGAQIARGLDAAHGQGIVHRDLKPENVFLTRDGRVKILDFGLAKLTAAGAEGGGGDSTVSAHTDPGTLLGTAGYQSPEQVRGAEADARSDIFGLGAVLYEMLAGRRAFRAETTAATLAAILKEDPPELGSAQGMVPPALDRIVRRCLEKDPAHRFRSAHDLAFALEALSGTGPAVPALPVTPASRRLAITSLVAVGLLATCVAAFLAGRWSAARGTATAVRTLRLTDIAGLEENPALSPDGRLLAFTAEVGRARQIWIRLVAGGTPLQVTHDAGDHVHPRWLPDSSSLIYYSSPGEDQSHGTVAEVSALGGPSRRITESLGAGDLSHDGTRVAFFRLENGRLELATCGRDGSDIRTILPLDAGYRYLLPRWSPDDRSIAYRRARVFEDELFVVPSTGGAPRSVLREGYPLRGLTWLLDSSGLVVSSSRGSTMYYLPTYNLWTVRLADKRLTQLTFGEVSYLEPDLARSGSLVASREQIHFDIWRVPVDGDGVENALRAERVTRQTGRVQTPSVSPDGWELVYLSDSGGHGNLWIRHLQSGEARQITHEQDPNVTVGVPVWSPDGKSIAYYSNRGYREPPEGGYWLVRPDGSGLRKLVRGGWGTWSPDGRWFYCSVSRPPFHLIKVPAQGGEPVTLRTDDSRAPAPSADGTLYHVVEMPSLNGRPVFEIRAANPETGPSRVVARISASRVPGWQFIHPVLSPDGKWLALLLSDGGTTNVWAVSTADGALRPLTDFGHRPTFIARRVSWSPDGRSIFAALGEGDSDVVLFEGLAPH